MIQSVLAIHSSSLWFWGAHSAKFVLVPITSILYLYINPLSSEEYPILKYYDCTKASIINRVLGGFIGLAFDGDDWTLSMLNAELAHSAHEDPLKWSKASTSHN